MQPNDPKRSDGKAIVVEAVSAFDKGAFVTKNRGIDVTWYGFACADAQSGDQVAIDVSMSEFELVIPAGLTANVGDLLYVVHATGVITDTDPDDGSVTRFLKVTVAKDSNNVVWGIQLPQYFTW
jgi:hypothetical protein